MTTYTVRYAHLEQASKLKVGDRLTKGSLIGKMGSTGKSTKAHLHLDVARTTRVDIYRLPDIEKNNPPAGNPRQAAYFIDKDLFNIKPIITTHYADPEYIEIFNKVHFGFDLVPSDWTKEDHYNIYWNRTMLGKVSAVGFDAAGYGNYVYVQFEVNE